MPRAKKSTYSNRTDLNQPAAEPVTAVPGQAYGAAGAQRNAQRAIPIGTPPTPSPVVPLNAQPPRPQVQPGSLPFLQPSNRPQEPITTGLDFGPGAGSEVMNTPPTQPILSDQMMHAALTSGSDSLSSLALGLHSVGL